MRFFTASLTAVVAYSRDFTMSRPIACVPLNRAADFGSAAPADDVGDLAERDELAVALRDDEPGEVLGPIEAALEANRALLERRRHLADRRREVLRAQRVDDLIDADARAPRARSAERRR